MNSWLRNSAPSTGTSPRPGSLETFSRRLSLSMPAMAIVWPVASSTVELALRLVSAGTKNWALTPLPTPTCRLLAGTRSETETSTLRLMLPESSTTGRKPSPTPNSLCSMATWPSPWGTGMGNSPPARNWAG